jgi:hypothetical protein
LRRPKKQAETKAPGRVKKRPLEIGTTVSENDWGKDKFVFLVQAPVPIRIFQEGSVYRPADGHAFRPRIIYQSPPKERPAAKTNWNWTVRFSLT